MMKVAVISENGRPSGKTTFCLCLGMLFAMTQGKTSVIFSNGKMDDLFNSVKNKKDKSLLTSVSVLQSVLQSSSDVVQDILDYGVHIGGEQFYAYDLFDSTYDLPYLYETLSMAMRRVKVDLILVEVQGDYRAEEQKRILMESDAVLYLFEPSLKAIAAAKDYHENMPEYIEKRTGYICSKYDSFVTSEKAIAKQVGITVRNLMLFPYNSNLAKEALLGTLDTVPRYIAIGRPEVMNLRIKLVEVMQYLFDSARVKYIKDQTKWIIK